MAKQLKTGGVEIDKLYQDKMHTNSVRSVDRKQTMLGKGVIGFVSRANVYSVQGPGFETHSLSSLYNLNLPPPQQSMDTYHRLSLKSERIRGIITFDNKYHGLYWCSTVLSPWTSTLRRIL